MSESIMSPEELGFIQALKKEIEADEKKRDKGAEKKCLRPLGCDCPDCIAKVGPIHPGNVGKELRSNPTGVPGEVASSSPSADDKVTSVCSHDPTKPPSVSVTISHPPAETEKPKPAAEAMSCPHCGGGLENYSDWAYVHYAPIGKECVWNGCYVRKNEIHLWNRRVAPPVTMRLAEAVKAYQYSNGENYPEKKHDMDMALAAFEAEFGGKKPT